MKKKQNKKTISLRRAQGGFQQNNEEKVASQNVTHYNDSAYNSLTRERIHYMG